MNQTTKLNRVFPACGLLFAAVASVSAVSPARSDWISGEVRSELSGQPISNAWVRVASPAMDLRNVRDARRGIFDGRTDASGRFMIQGVPFGRISINAFAPGFEEAAGTQMRGNFEFHDVPSPSKPGEEFKILLKPALYVAGTIQDQSGRPLVGARVAATLEDANSTAYVCFDTARSDGHFEIHDFPVSRPSPELRGRLTITHDAHLTDYVLDVYSMDKSLRTDLTIRLSAGERVHGMVRSTEGKPFSGAIVEAVPADAHGARRRAITDPDGRFELRGLLMGGVALIARTEDFGLKAERRLELSDGDTEVSLRLEPVVSNHAGPEVQLLGMRLADASQELKAVYNLDDARGVVILDPGSSHQRLGIGALEPGLRFWMVGRKVVRNLGEMVDEILRVESIAPPGDPNEGCRGSVRVVYVFRNGEGTNTQRLRLSAEDIQELKRVAITLRR